MASPAPQAADPLSRYRALQLVSILLIAGGLLLAVWLGWQNRDLLTGDGVLPTQEEAAGALIGLTLAGLAFVTGLVMNAVRAVVVRQDLPASRYRGPSIIVMLLIATVLTAVSSIGLAGELLDLQSGDALTPWRSLLLLTVTQLGLLAAAAAFVAMPRALAGVRLLPRTRLWRSILIGAALVVPAWIAAQLVSVAIIVLLEQLFDVSPQPGIAEMAIARVDPVVLVVALVIVAPIAEEVFFRGVAFNAWEREYGTRAAVYGSSLLFALIHGSVFLLLPIFALGVVLASVYQWTRSLPAVIVLHAGFNGVTLALGLLDRYQVIRLP